MIPQPNPTTFPWFTGDGRKLTVSEMSTEHIYHSIRLIHNSLLPPSARASKPKPRQLTAPPIYYRRAMEAFIAELRYRNLESAVPSWVVTGLQRLRMQTNQIFTS